MKIKQVPPRQPITGIRITTGRGNPSETAMRRLKIQKQMATSQHGIKYMLSGISSKADQKIWPEAYSCQEQAHDPSVKP
jgi:hypothetical protein